MACPHVAGVASQIRGRYPALSTSEVTDVVLCLATTGALSGLRADTVNKLLFNGLNSPDAASCLANLPDPVSPSPSPPPSAASPPPSPVLALPPPSPTLTSPPSP